MDGRKLCPRMNPPTALKSVLGLLVLAAGLLDSDASDSAAVKKLFAQPPREFTSAPLWVWNDRLTEDQIRGTLRDLAGQGVKQVFVHPRPGLMTPYLGDDWFKLWKIALKEAGQLDMNVWIYDENSYPSGFAGGWVPELMPDARGQGLALKETKTAPKWNAQTLAVFRLADGQAENVTQQTKAGAALGDGKFLIATIERADNSPWHANRCYVNLLTPGVTEKFLEVTMGAYEREIGPHFGQRVPGVFTDEPEIRPAGGLPWCDDLPEQFQRRWGYNLVDNLASLAQPVGDWRKVRHNFFSTLNDLFIERWARPYYDYCEKRGLEFTGHYWEHEWPNAAGVPDSMAMAAWQQRPGIDILMNQYAEHTHAQFGNVRSGREISSLANQLGRERTLVELYGAGGWDLRFEDMKRIGDWLQVLGVNTLDEHLSYVTLRGARKNDHPQSFSYHEPWWPAYHVLANYFARLSAALTQGQQVNRVLVIEPTTTAWMYQGDGAKLDHLGNAFAKLVTALEAAQIEYDLGCEDVIARQGAVKDNQLWVGQRGYDVVVLPPGMENIQAHVADLGEQFLNAGGKIVCLGTTPTHMDGSESTRPAEGANEPGWISARPEEAVTVLRHWNREDEFSIERAANDRGILFHHRRQLADGQLLFLVNTSIESPSTGVLDSNLRGVERWDLNTGKAEPYPFSATNAGVTASFNLPPTGSLLLFLSNKPLKSAPPAAGTITSLSAIGPMKIQRTAPNVLKLDYVDITAGGETKSNIYYYAAAQFAFQRNGLDRNPWDSAVQFKDELISRKFPANSGFTASYRFTLDRSVPKNLAIVIERPDLYTITCNGKPVAAKPGDWWLDKAFGRIALAGAAQPGENIVTLQARPFTIYHELEAAFVLGDFALKPADHGFIIAADTAPGILKRRGDPAHSNNPDGTAWLSGGIGFRQNADGSPAEDRQPFVIFDLGKTTELSSLRIWNYNESNVRDLTGRGAKVIRLRGTAASQPDGFDLDLGEFTLARATANSAAQELSLNRPHVRFVKLAILSNQNRVAYPASGKLADDGFVGLAEVAFIAPTRGKVAGVKIAGVSSELASHGREAVHLVDGSGLVEVRPGWNDQGHPFYSAGVSYRQSFRVDQSQGRFRVALPDWYGSVAEVTVNGKSAGYIVSAPWECDVSKQIKRGRNEVEVIIIGTLKNTLGPHHGNPALGTAWPAMFRTGPDNGPPPGAQYSTVGYGLFEPFVLRQAAVKE
jgi:hypothetical protein